MKINKQKGFIVPLLIGIIALLIIGVGVYIYSNKKVVEAPVVVDTNLPATTTDIVYVDKVNGYQIKLPSDWIGYKVVDGKFFLPTSDKTWKETINGEYTAHSYASVFIVLKYSIVDWNKMKESCGVPKGPNWDRGCYEDNGEYTLGRTNEFVFVLDGPNAGPDDIQFAKLRKEIMAPSYLKNNFSIISLTSTTEVTKDWETYTNTQFGFSFQYPANAKIYDDCCQGSMIADLSVYYPSNSTGAADGMELNKVVRLQLHSDYNISNNTGVDQNNPNTKLITKGNLGMNIWVSDVGYKDIFKIITSTFKFTN